ncbi:hypothetical protein RJI07_09200 [Mycoplasmatota bacterium WC30]
MKTNLKYFVPILTIIGLFLRDILEIDITMTYFLIVLSVVLITQDINGVVSSIVFLLPYENSIMITVLFIVAIFTILIKNNVKFNFNFLLVLIILIIFWELLHSFNYTFSINLYVKFSAALILFLLVYFQKNQIKWKSIIWFYIFGVFSFVSLVILKQSLIGGLSISAISSSFDRLGDYYDIFIGYDLYNNPNAIGLQLNMATSLLFIDLILFKKHSFYKITLILFFTFVGLITQSKTFIVVLLFQILYVMTFGSKTFKQLVYRFALIITGGLIIYAGTLHYFPSLMDRLFLRFSGDYFFSGRDLIFEQYNQIVLSDIKHFFFGTGIQIINIKSGLTSNPHNMLQEIIVAWGFVGLIWFALFIIYILMDSYKHFNRKVTFKKFMMYLIPLTTLLISTQASRLFGKPEIIATFIIVIAAIYDKRYLNRELVKRI